jgi:hypothetical protein
MSNDKDMNAPKYIMRWFMPSEAVPIEYMRLNACYENDLIISESPDCILAQFGTLLI